MKLSKAFLFLSVVGLSFHIYAREDREAFKKALDACVTETGVKRPENGSTPSDEDRSKMGACLSGKGFSRPESVRPSESQREAFQAALKSCSIEIGVSKPEKGMRPSDEEMAKMEACLLTKGIEKPLRSRDRSLVVKRQFGVSASQASKASPQ